MRLELITEAGSVDQLRTEWDDLAHLDLRDGFFRTFVWYKLWLEHVKPQAKPLVIAARAEDGRLLGLAPLCRTRYTDLGFTLNAVEFGGRDVVSGDFLDFLVAPQAKSEVLAAILGKLWDLRSSWDLLTFGEVIVESDLHIALLAWAKQHGLRIRTQEERFCPYIVLPETFDDYLRGLSATMRYHIRRRMRNFTEKYGGRIETSTEPEELRCNLDILRRLHLARWREVDKQGSLGRPELVRFLQALCASPPNGAKACMYLLKCHKRPIAALLAFHFERSALYYQSGWDPEPRFCRLSPGVVLMAHSIREAINEGLRYYEFLRGGEDYKFRWARAHRKTLTLILARTPLAQSYVLAARVKDILKQLLGRQTKSTDLIRRISGRQEVSGPEQGSSGMG